VHADTKVQWRSRRRGAGALKKLYFKNVDEAAHEVEEKGWVIGVSHPTIRKEV
jgi:hypothetical protein